MMEVRRGFLGLAPLPTPSCTSVGNFDGVHRGHRAVIESAVAEADRRGLAATVCTFDPHTRSVVDPGGPPELLQTLDQRLAAFEALGVDRATVIPFDEEVAALPAREFVERFVVAVLRTRSLHVSERFRFGRGGAGDVGLLAGCAERLGFDLQLVPPLLDGGEQISSTRIRRALRGGDVQLAARLLGRPFALSGRVVPGEGRGRRIGIPTANLDVDNGCLPARGVYVARLRHRLEDHRAVCNVGVQPTFEDDDEVVVEAHAFEAGDSLDLAGERVELELLDRLRDERAFEGAEALVRQIRKDIEAAESWFD